MSLFQPHITVSVSTKEDAKIDSFIEFLHTWISIELQELLQ